MRKLTFLFSASYISKTATLTISDDHFCQTEIYGYYDVVPPGVPDWFYQIPGRFNYDYTCNLQMIETCRYVKRIDGIYIPCPGRLIQYVDTIRLRN